MLGRAALDPTYVESALGPAEVDIMPTMIDWLDVNRDHNPSVIASYMRTDWLKQHVCRDRDMGDEFVVLQQDVKWLLVLKGEIITS